MGYEAINFPKGTKFLVTGSAGFIGSNLAEKLLELGMHVRGLDNLSSGKIENMESFKNHLNFEFIEGDIKDFEICKKACNGIDYVLHQAALGSVPRSFQWPQLFEENNIKGTLNMMEGARQSNTVKTFVFASSSSVYGDSTNLPKKEGEEGNVLSPYALTKVVNEKYAELYTKYYNLPCIGLRYFNVFGKRQDPNSQYSAVIPLFAKQLLIGEIPIINGDGNQSRDFTYIENVIEANLKACVASEKAFGQSFNIACGERYSINQVYEIMCTYLGIIKDPIYGKERLGDVKHSHADISKANQMFNYQPAWTFKDGFEHAIRWYQTFFENVVNI